MRPLPPSLACIPFLIPAAAFAAAEDIPTPWYPSAAEGCGALADEVMDTTKVVDAVLGELGVTPTPVDGNRDISLPEVEEGQSAAVSDGGMFFDAAHSRLAYLDNVRLNDARVQLRAAHRLYLQLPKEQTQKEADEVGEQVIHPADAPAAKPAAQKGKPKEKKSAAALPKADAPLQVNAYDALIDTVHNRMMFTSGPAVPQVVIRQGGNELIVGSAEGKAARAFADEEGNLLLEGGTIRLEQEAADGGGKSHFFADGGRAFYHAASHTLIMEGPVDASYRNGESSLRCTGRLAVTLQPEGTPVPKKDGFMSQFTAMRFSGIAAATATGDVHLRSRSGKEEVELAGSALRYNGLTGEVEVPGAPCVLSYGEGGKNTLITDGSLALEQNGDIRMSGNTITGRYERPAREKGGAPVSGSLSARAPLTFHASTGTVTTSALHLEDSEASFSCTGAVQIALAPRAAEKLASLPPREKAGMLNLAIARYEGINTIKAAGEVRARLLDPAKPSEPEASFTGSQLAANLATGEVELIGTNETAGLAFRGYALSGTPDESGGEARVHLHPNGDIDARAAHVQASLPSDKGLTTLDCDNVAHLAREARLLNLGANTRIHSPEGILTTKGPLMAVLAASPTPRKPASPRYPQLVYDFAGLESAETGEGATLRAPQGSMQCTGQLSILMDSPPAAPAAKSTIGGIRSAIATGQVAIAAKDATGRIMRASGDRLEVNGATGEKRLTGSRVRLEDANNRHEASGAGAAIIIDAQNNARITGEHQSTSATGIQKQVDQQKKANE